jgi:hypothetical protein
MAFSQTDQASIFYYIMKQESMIRSVLPDVAEFLEALEMAKLEVYLTSQGKMLHRRSGIPIKIVAATAAEKAIYNDPLLQVVFNHMLHCGTCFEMTASIQRLRATSDCWKLTINPVVK